MKDQDDIESRIRNLTKQSSIAELMTLIGLIFKSRFGVTSDARRLEDIATEGHEFQRALSRGERLGEYGDLLCTLLAFADEQDVDPAVWIRQTLDKINRRAEIYAARGDKKKVAIIGTSGDCPTLGHVAMGKAILNSTQGFDEVWYMPPYGYAGSKRLSPPQHRAEMCRLLESVDPRFKFFGYEMDHKLGGETLHTMLKLSQDPIADQHRFYFVLSTETATQLSSWSRADELKRVTLFITLPRPGYEPNVADLWYMQAPHVYLKDAQGLLPISSTKVRDAYAGGDITLAESLVTPEVASYIREHELYRKTA